MSQPLPLPQPLALAIAKDRYLTPQYAFADTTHIPLLSPPRYGQDITSGCRARAPQGQFVGDDIADLKARMLKLLKIFANGDRTGMAKRLFDGLTAMTHRLATVALASVIVGLLLTPLAYIGIGALGGFAIAFAAISMPLLLLCSLFLFHRYLRRPAASAHPRRWPQVAEAAAWLLVVFFLAIVSGFTLLTTAERFGLFCTLALVASLVALPWMALRPSALVARVAQWPAAAVAAGALMSVGVLAGGAVVYLVTPSRFL
ncbi:hypothetical protein [Acidovorax sp. NCPPB 4044]|uniref:hypothetical protein n=1 Tax=Acidovorax sp. NCPPB 4044 TaxID=2940490 RepID=UPI00230204A7|nr:hypothetical protein [Acidovorax sp. NCPPB 4044]MDA8519839.1 hypothetical protein [Acidovorax sp. NCPPB 4044]